LSLDIARFKAPLSYSHGMPPSDGEPPFDGEEETEGKAQSGKQSEKQWRYRLSLVMQKTLDMVAGDTDF
jgi:hypothetical protein